MKLLSIFTLALLMISASSAHAKISKKKQRTSTSLSTDVNFDGRIVKGKYSSSSEGIATVENEKDIDDLIGVRTHFKDRLEKSESLR